MRNNQGSTAVGVVKETSNLRFTQQVYFQGIFVMGIKIKRAGSSVWGCLNSRRGTWL